MQNVIGPLLTHCNGAGNVGSTVPVLARYRHVYWVTVYKLLWHTKYMSSAHAKHFVISYIQYHRWGWGGGSTVYNTEYEYLNTNLRNKKALPVKYSVLAVYNVRVLA